MSHLSNSLLLCATALSLSLPQVGCADDAAGESSDSKADAFEGDKVVTRDDEGAVVEVIKGQRIVVVLDNPDSDRKWVVVDSDRKIGGPTETLETDAGETAMIWPTNTFLITANQTYRVKLGYSSDATDPTAVSDTADFAFKVTDGSSPDVVLDLADQDRDDIDEILGIDVIQGQRIVLTLPDKVAKHDWVVKESDRTFGVAAISTNDNEQVMTWETDPFFSLAMPGTSYTVVLAYRHTTLHTDKVDASFTFNIVE